MASNCSPSTIDMSVIEATMSGLALGSMSSRVSAHCLGSWKVGWVLACVLGPQPMCNSLRVPRGLSVMRVNPQNSDGPGVTRAVVTIVGFGAGARVGSVEEVERRDRQHVEDEVAG